MISKHLAVLKKVGLVSERRVGRQRVYRVNPEKLKPIHDWVTPFERHWQESFERLDEYLERAKAEERKHGILFWLPGWVKATGTPAQFHPSPEDGPLGRGRLR